MKKIYNKEKIYPLINKLKDIQHIFLKDYGVNDIFSNSKFYEIIIAIEFNQSFVVPYELSKKDIQDYCIDKEIYFTGYSQIKNMNINILKKLVQITVGLLMITLTIL